MDVSENSGFSPQIIHLFIGFSMIFTIHFGGEIPLFLVQHPNKPWSWGCHSNCVLKKTTPGNFKEVNGIHHLCAECSHQCLRKSQRILMLILVSQVASPTWKRSPQTGDSYWKPPVNWFYIKFRGSTKDGGPWKKATPLRHGDFGAPGSNLSKFAGFSENERLGSMDFFFWRAHKALFLGGFAIWYLHTSSVKSFGEFWNLPFQFGW